MGQSFHLFQDLQSMRGCPKSRGIFKEGYRGSIGVYKVLGSGTILGVPIIRIKRYWGLYWSSPISGNYHVGIPELSARLTYPRLLQPF